MGLVLAIGLGIWLLGYAMKVPRRQRWMLIAVLLGAVILGHLVLPDDAPLRRATGGTAAVWLMLLGLGAVVYGYISLLGQLRRRVAKQAPEQTPTGTFREVELSRYARHMALREIGGVGQRHLKEARVLVVGAGGLGAPACLYLAAAGVGTIGVIDDDRVENTNLQRQIIHRDQDIGVPKVFSAEQAMRAQNPHIDVRPYHRRFSADIADELFADYDLILEGSDNFETRYLVNQVAVAQGKPVVAAALTQWEGQISTYDPANDAPCYACVFPTAPDPALVPSCAAAGVVGPLPGVLGSMMALEAVKLITGAGDSLRGRLLLFDGLYSENRVMKVARNKDCPTCGTSALETETL